MKSSVSASRRVPARLAACLTLALAIPAGAQAQWTTVGSVSTPGQTVYVPGTSPNDAVLLVNGNNLAYSDRTVLTATLVHDGFLNASIGLDHIAVSARGGSMDRLFPLLNRSVWTTSYFGYGEQIDATAGPAAAGTPLGEALYGRGPTFWPAGSPLCSDTRYPCMIYENYTIQISNSSGNLCAGLLCGYDVPLRISSAPFQITVIADDWDVVTNVSQNGVLMASTSCRTISGGDWRCGAQNGDFGMIDGFIANVVGDGAAAGRRLGATNVTIRAQNETPR